ncbi:hypothetical protein STEG23_033680, partial [Scotinomys teguina]
HMLHAYLQDQHYGVASHQCYWSWTPRPPLDPPKLQEYGCRSNSNSDRITKIRRDLSSSKAAFQETQTLLPAEKGNSQPSKQPTASQKPRGRTFLGKTRPESIIDLIDMRGSMASH